MDIGKIVNKLYISGTGTNQNVMFQDALSSDIYGTRTMSTITNSFISTQADLQTYGSMLLGYTTAAKYNINVTIPAHPEIEIGDAINVWDTVNNKSVNNAIITQHVFNPMTWTSQLTAVSYKKETM